jgi:L-fuconolactonase
MPHTASAADTAHEGLYQGPIIDTHIHLFDPTRPEGIPWPESSSPIYRRTLPEDYFAIAREHGVVGAIAVEASPWPRDNNWLLDVCRSHTGMLGFVGNLFPEDMNFPAALERFAAEPLFLGTRYGNLWGRDLWQALRNPRFVSGMKQLAECERVLDSANPDPDLICALLALSDQVPDLRIVIDHLPNSNIPEKRRKQFIQDLAEIAKHESVFIKLSEVPRTTNGVPGLDVAEYEDWLDHLWDLFGAERIMFGSDWPNSENTASYVDTVELSRRYLAKKSIQAQEQVLFSNSKRIYGWQDR